MQCTARSVGPYDNNAYLLADGDDLVLVDAAQDAAALLDWIGGRRVSTIVTTHRHPDHIAALPEVARATGARLVTGRPDAAAIAAATGLDLEGLWDGDTVRVGAASLAVIGLVGHTPGGIALAHTPDDGPATVITGDSLFPGGVGKTRTPEEFASLLGDVTAKLFDRFGDDTVVLPGHGRPTTLGAERPHLAAWRARGW
nr:MBL fold metallo-hydrolase [Propionibacterium sp.]